MEIALQTTDADGAVSIYRDQVKAREICESECNSWHKWFGEHMRDFRRDNKVRIHAVANALGLSKSYVSMLETGQRMWSEDLIRQYINCVRKS